MNLFKSTKAHSKFWRERKIDWRSAYLSTWNHPHRFVISSLLKSFKWGCLYEIGCGPGPNLVNILKHFRDVQLGGVDISSEAIALAKKTFKGGMFAVGAGNNIMMSDKSVDVILSDMSLIYVGPLKIKEYINEIKRVARNRVVLCEFHSESFWQRLRLRFTSGYHAYNYEKLLKKAGFYDIFKYKLTEQDWPGGDPQKTFGHVFIAKVPKR